MRAYRLLLRLLPASFRDEYGGEMTALFADRLAAASPAGRAALWAGEIASLVATAARTHAELLGQDLRFALRAFRRAKAFAFTAIGVTALGIGATTVAFSLADHALLRPLPFPHPEGLVRLWQDQSFRGYPRMELSPPNFRDWHARSTSFSGMAAFWDDASNLVGGGDPERVEGVRATAELWSVLDVAPEIGRTFAAEDEAPGAPGVLVLSHALWRDRFAADRAVLGRKVVLDGEPFTVIGVMPESFRFPDRDARYWRPIHFVADNGDDDRTNYYLSVVARLAPGVTFDAARAEMNLVAAQLAKAYPDANERNGAALARMSDLLSWRTRRLLEALVGASLCVLAIACTNLASLLLARAAFRRRELAVRTALGAGRQRLVRQLVTESLALAFAGGLLGVGLAVAITPFVARLVPTTLPIAAAPSLDLRILAFAAATTLATGLAFGVLPALRVSRGASAQGLRDGGRSGVGGRRERLRAVLVVAEVTLSVVLLVSTALLLRTLWRIESVDPGFDSRGVLTLRTALPIPAYNAAERRAQFYDHVLSEVRALPGVANAGFISFLPMTMRGGIWPVAPAGAKTNPPGATLASLRFVTPGFFATLSIPIRRGRDVADSDTAKSEFVAVVSESFARRQWPGEDPIGRTFRFAFSDRTVVGVVGDVRVRGLEQESEPQVYVPHRQVEDGGIIGYIPKDLAVRSTVPTESLLPAIRKIVAEADPAQPISDVRTLAEVVAGESAPRAVQLRLLGAFAAIAVLLAGLGIHGLLAFSLAQRYQEIGVRRALGAGGREIVALVVGQGARLAAIGVALGAALALAAGRGMASLLVGVGPADGASFAAAMALAAAMTLAGCLVPAIRAVLVDPATVLRAE
jgi:predicted permease